MKTLDSGPEAEPGLSPGPGPDLAPDHDFESVFWNFRIFEHEHCSTYKNYQLMKLKGRNMLWINTQGARRLNIDAGDLVRLESPWGAVVRNPAAANPREERRC